MTSAGAPLRENLKTLNFQVKKEGKKYTALCLFCKSTLSNVATKRLEAHRKRCNFNIADAKNDCIVFEPQDLDSSQVMDLDNSTISIMDISNNDIILSYGATSSSQSTAPSSSSRSTTPSTSSQSLTPSTSSSSSPTPPVSSISKFKIPKTVLKKNQGIECFMDKMSSKEETELNTFVARFFYGCNIPLSVIEAAPFKEMIKKLRPSYASKLPGRKALATTLLDKEYSKHIQSAQEAVDANSVILIDGWKNTSSNTKTVVTMLHNVNGAKIFLEAYDVSGEQETADKLSEIIELSITQAKEMYDTNVFAVVSDNAANMLKMGRDVNIWHSNCSAHVANLLAKNIIDKDMVKKTTIILKEFRHSDLEARVLLKGGTKIKIPAETRWCSHRDCFSCLIKNLPIMRSIVAEADSMDKKIKQEVKTLLFDDFFEEEVKEMISVLDPVCQLLNKVQATSSSIADAVQLWLTLQLPQNTTLKEFFQKRISQALNIYALIAFYLHPYYDRTLLSPQNIEDITDFLFNYLVGEAIQELDLFLHKKSYFGVLLSKNLNKDPYIFWRMASIKYPTLAKTATKLLTIPASSAQIERLFSNWAYIHSDVRNRLSFERSKKLVAIYYSIKVQNNDIVDSDEEL